MPSPLARGVHESPPGWARRLRPGSPVWLAVALVLVLGAAGAATAAQELLLAGQGPDGTSVLWLAGLRESVTGIHALTRGQWVLVAESHGQATAVCAADGRLHAFFAGRGYQIYDPVPGSGRSGRLWPRELADRTVLAAAAGAVEPSASATAPAATAPAAQAATAPLGDGRYELYILLSGASPATAPTATTAASLAATTPAAEPGPVLLGLARGQWQALPAVPAGVLPAGGRAMLAGMAEGLYLLGCTADGWPAGLARLAGEQWVRLPGPMWRPGDGRIHWLIGLGPDLLLAGTIEDESGRRVWFRRLEGRLDGPAVLGQPRIVRQQAGKGELVLPAGSPAAMSRFGRMLALGWGAAGDWQAASVDLDGLAHALGRPDGRARGEEPLLRWFETVLMALTVLLVLALLVRQRRTMTVPFNLPAGAVPSHWFKRVLAFVIDYFPMGLLGAVLTGYTGMEEQELRRMLDTALSGGRLDAPLAPGLAGLGLYVGYAILTEKLFGATLGKTLLRMRVIGEGGRSPSWLAVVIRNVAKPVELLAPRPVPVIFLIWPLFSRLRRRVGDVVAGTAVVDLTMRPALVGPAVPPPAEEGEESAEG